MSNNSEELTSYVLRLLSASVNLCLSILHWHLYLLVSSLVITITIIQANKYGDKSYEDVCRADRAGCVPDIGQMRIRLTVLQCSGYRRAERHGRNAEQYLFIERVGIITVEDKNLHPDLMKCKFWKTKFKNVRM